jgi:hypothetical protein
MGTLLVDSLGQGLRLIVGAGMIVLAEMLVVSVSCRIVAVRCGALVAN